METKDLALHTQTKEVYIPTASDWKFMVEWGADALKSGTLPTSIKTPQAAAIIALKGRELGISFMTAMSHIHVINGKPTMSAELMQAQARKNLPGLKISIVKSDDKEASIKFKRPDDDSWFTSTFTLEDAKRADLLKNPTWSKYPKAMLFSRAVSAGLRIICPEALMGVSYTPEELGAPVDETGNVIPTTGRVVEEPKIPEVVKNADAEKQVLLTRIMALQKELNLKNEDITQAIHREFKKKYADLALDETYEFIKILETQVAMEKAEPVKLNTPEWDGSQQHL